MATLPSEMVGHSPFLPDPAAAYGPRGKVMGNKFTISVWRSGLSSEMTVWLLCLGNSVGTERDIIQMITVQRSLSSFCSARSSSSDQVGAQLETSIFLVNTFTSGFLGSSKECPHCLQLFLDRASAFTFTWAVFYTHLVFCQYFKPSSYLSFCILEILQPFE